MLNIESSLALVLYNFLSQPLHPRV